MGFIDHKTYKHYPKYISTFILSDYITKFYTKKDDGVYKYLIDDLVFNFHLIDNQIAECYITKHNKYYDYFCRNYATPELKPDEII